jgi:hypothetical protein
MGKTLWKLGDRPSDNGLIGPGCTGNGQRWCTRIKTFGNRPFNQRRKCTPGHVNRRRCHGIGKALPIEIAR